MSEVSAVTAAKMCGSSVPSSGSISSKVSTTSAPLIDYANIAYFEKQCTHELVSSSALKVQLVKLSEELFFCYLSLQVFQDLWFSFCSINPCYFSFIVCLILVLELHSG